MNCPECNGKTVVTDTTHTTSNETYRKKRCAVCGHKFCTVEFEVDYDEQFRQVWNDNCRSRYELVKERRKEK